MNKRADKIGDEQGRPIRERGVIVAGGLMAGGALGGVFGAGLRLLPKYREDMIQTPFYSNEPISQTHLGADVRGSVSVYMVRFREKEGCVG